MPSIRASSSVPGAPVAPPQLFLPFRGIPVARDPGVDLFGVGGVVPQRDGHQRVTESGDGAELAHEQIPFELRTLVADRVQRLDDFPYIRAASQSRTSARGSGPEDDARMLKRTQGLVDEHVGDRRQRRPGVLLDISIQAGEHPLLEADRTWSGGHDYIVATRSHSAAMQLCSYS